MNVTVINIWVRAVNDLPTGVGGSGVKEHRTKQNMRIFQAGTLRETYMYEFHTRVRILGLYIYLC